jgi:hypothetical protein
MKRVPRIGSILFLILTMAAVCSAQTTFYYPHVADGVLGATVWKTTIYLTNPAGAGTASGTVTFTQESSTIGQAGTPFPISFTDETGASAGSGNTITFSIPGGATKKYVSSGTGTYAGGFAKVETTTGVVNGTAIFSEFAGGVLIAEAGVPSAAAVPRQSIFVDTVGGFNIGVAYVNPSVAAAPVRLELFNSGAQAVLNTTVNIGPGNHKAAFVTELFPGTPEMTGSMQITSTSGVVAAIALRFASSGVFTTLPPVTLASVMNPAIEWLEQRPWLQPLTSVAKLLGAFQLRIG